MAKLLALACACALLVACGRQQVPPPSVEDAAAAELEQIRDALANTYWRLGHSDSAGRHQAVSQDSISYRIAQVQTLDDGRYLLTAFLYRKGEPSLLPVPVPMHIRPVGEQLLLRLEPTQFPGLGSYSADFLLSDGRFAGTWAGSGVGGWFFGEVLNYDPAKSKPVSGEK